MSKKRVLSTYYDYHLIFGIVESLYKYFEEINNGAMYPQDTPNKLILKDHDVVFSFFIFCYHMKDWLVSEAWKTQKSRIEKKRFIENYINKCPLKYCADLCNGIKHRKLSRRRNVAAPSFEGTNLSFVYRDKSEPKTQVRFVLSNTNGKDAFIIASECLEAWKIFIKENIDPKG